MFITHLERVMDVNKDLKGAITVHGVSIKNLRFADDIDLSSSSLQEAAQLLNKQGKQSGLVINKAKTQIMVFGNNNIDQLEKDRRPHFRECHMVHVSQQCVHI